MWKSFTYWAAWAFYPVAIYYWSLWSRLYRSVTKIRGLTLLTNLTPSRTQALLDQLPWSPDRWTDLWDVAADPTKFQRSLDTRAETGKVRDESRDCDDFAGWAATVLAETYSPTVVAISYQRRNTASIAGHVVCIYREPAQDNRYYHMGNWGIRGPFSSEEAAVRSVPSEADAILVGYSIMEPSLRISKIVRA